MILYKVNCEPFLVLVLWHFLRRLGRNANFLPLRITKFLHRKIHRISFHVSRDISQLSTDTLLTAPPALQLDLRTQRHSIETHRGSKSLRICKILHVQHICCVGRTFLNKLWQTNPAAANATYPRTCNLYASTCSSRRTSHLSSKHFFLLCWSSFWNEWKRG